MDSHLDIDIQVGALSRLSQCERAKRGPPGSPVHNKKVDCLLSAVLLAAGMISRGFQFVQETERMKAIVAELSKLGAKVEEGRDHCVITPPAWLQPTPIDTFDDRKWRWHS